MRDKHFDVVGVGTAVVDYLAVAPHYPTVDSQMQLEALKREGGGNVSTTLVTLARLGLSTCFIGKLGDDELGRFALESVRRAGVDVDRVIIEPGASAGVAFIIVDAQSGRRTILWSNEGKPVLAAKELDRRQVLNCRALHLDEYEMQASIAAARMVRESEREIIIVLDAESGLSGIEELLPLSDVLIASRDFAVGHTGSGDFKGAALALHRQFPARIVVVTAGEEGCFCVAGEEAFHQPAFATEPIDTTGCGDVFRGAFTYGLLHGWSLHRVAEFASATAALKCQALGGRAGIPTLAQVESFLASHGGRP